MGVNSGTRRIVETAEAGVFLIWAGWRRPETRKGRSCDRRTFGLPDLHDSKGIQDDRLADPDLHCVRNFVTH